MSATLLSGLTWKYILQKEVLGAQCIWSSYSAAAVSVGPSGLTLHVLGDLASSRMYALFQPKVYI